MHRIIFFACLFLAACSKSSKEPNEELPGTPLQKARGATAGPLVSAAIGANGGVLATADGRVKITVPAGAVGANTTFSIQPIQNTLRPGKPDSRSFRLLPENITFTQPITVELKYDPADLSFGTEDVLRVAYQTAAGFWKSVPAALNKTNHTLTVQVKHFCDFAFYNQFELFSNRDIATAGEKVSFAVGVVHVDEEKTGDDDDLLAPLLHYIASEFDHNSETSYTQLSNNYITRVKEWKVVTGGGNIVAKANGWGVNGDAEYTAPTTITEVKDAIIEVSLEGTKPIPDPTAPGGFRKLGQLIIRKTIKLTPGDFVLAQFNGADVPLNDGALAIAGNGLTAIAATNNALGMGVSISVGAMSTGGFSCELPQPNSGKASVTFNYKLPNGTAVVAAGAYCEMQGTEAVTKYSSGTLNITRFGAPGEIIEGRWSGSLYQETPNTNGCQFETKNVSVSFRIRRGA